MGYHTAGDIPNYWAYAKNFVLQDHMFEPNASWSLPSHLFLVSEWSAHCTQHDNPASCTNALQSPGNPPTSPPDPAEPGTNQSLALPGRVRPPHRQRPLLHPRRRLGAPQRRSVALPLVGGVPRRSMPGLI